MKLDGLLAPLNGETLHYSGAEKPVAAGGELGERITAEELAALNEQVHALLDPFRVRARQIGFDPDVAADGGRCGRARHPWNPPAPVRFVSSPRRVLRISASWSQ